MGMNSVIVIVPNVIVVGNMLGKSALIAETEQHAWRIDTAASLLAWSRHYVGLDERLDLRSHRFHFPGETESKAIRRINIML